MLTQACTLAHERIERRRARYSTVECAEVAVPHIVGEYKNNDGLSHLCCTGLYVKTEDNIKTMVNSPPQINADARRMTTDATGTTCP